MSFLFHIISRNLFFKWELMVNYIEVCALKQKINIGGQNGEKRK